MTHTAGAHLFKFILEVGDLVPHGAAVHFQLGLPRATQANTAHRAGTSATAACLAGEVGPLAGQTRQEIFILRQFDLQLAFTGMGMLGENIQDDRGPVKDAYFFADVFFKLTLVTRREFVIEDNHLCQGILRQSFEFFHLPGANEGFRVGAIHFLGQFANNFQPGSIAQEGKFGERIIQG